MEDGGGADGERWFFFVFVFHVLLCGWEFFQVLCAWELPPSKWKVLGGRLYTYNYSKFFVAGTTNVDFVLGSTWVALKGSFFF